MEDDIVKKFMLALAYVGSFDEYPSCEIREPEKLKKVLQGAPPTKKSIDTLLLQENTPKEYDVEPEKEMFVELPPLEKLLFHESNEISVSRNLPDIPPSSKPLPALNAIPIVQTPLEEILAKIQFNDLKINYVKAQNQILRSYLQSGLQILKSLPPTGEQRSVYDTLKETYPNLESPITDIDAIEEFLNKAPCSLHEIEFLASILREHELRNKKL